jgi:hypothetical protein
MYVRTIYNTLASDEQKALPGRVSEKGDLIRTRPVAPVDQEGGKDEHVNYHEKGEC